MVGIRIASATTAAAAAPCLNSRRRLRRSCGDRQLDEASLLRRQHFRRLLEQARGVLQQRTRQQPPVLGIVVAPEHRGRGDPGAQPQQSAVLLDPVHRRRPFAQQRLMRQADHRGAVRRLIADQKVGVDESRDQRQAIRRTGELVARNPVLQDPLVVGRIGMNQPGQHLRQRGLDLRRQAGKDLVRPQPQRAVQPAQILVVGEPQHARAGAPPPELVQRELQQRQNGRVARSGIPQHVVEPFFRVTAPLERDARHHRRAADHLGNLGRTRPADGIDAALLDEQVAKPFRQNGAAAEKVRAQRGHDPDVAGQDHRAERFAERRAFRRCHGLVEDRLELIADHDQPDVAFRIRIGAGLARFLGGAIQRPLDRQRERRRIAEQRLERRRFVGQLGQRVLVQQRRRKAGERTLRADVGLEDRAPPRDHVLDDARAREDRQHAGLDERRFPDAAHAGDHEEAVTRRRTPAQDIDHLGDQAGPAAIDQRVLEIERLQAAERRAFPDLLLYRRLFDALEPVANPFAQMDLDQLLELRGLLEIVERRPEGAVRIAEPACRRTGSPHRARRPAGRAARDPSSTAAPRRSSGSRRSPAICVPRIPRARARTRIRCRSCIRCRRAG